MLLTPLTASCGDRWCWGLKGHGPSGGVPRCGGTPDGAPVGPAQATAVVGWLRLAQQQPFAHVGFSHPVFCDSTVAETGCPVEGNWQVRAQCALCAAAHVPSSHRSLARNKKTVKTVLPISSGKSCERASGRRVPYRMYVCAAACCAADCQSMRGGGGGAGVGGRVHDKCAWCTMVPNDNDVGLRQEALECRRNNFGSALAVWWWPPASWC